MKTTLKSIAVALVLATAATSASAQVYGEIGYSALNADGDGVDVDLGTLGATVGYEINKNFAVEAMIAGGVQDDDIQDPLFGNINVDLKHTYGAFLKPKMNLGQNFEIFARLGWAKTKIEANGGGVTDSDSESDFAYGVGVQYSFSPKAYVTGGYMNLLDKDGIEVDGWNIGVGYKF
ncbi:Porin family protein [Georgfuchsia toluolica]|uniref:Porin family protein n=1 Tax=Georgfuchsia toluolica TaxID=424218 RepID=A0A916J6N2_9PROT|nr:porin family protein [Georgfuchsia toluolica]CAG4884917.1 Porin family protein [Georgfuchsia toluolica]